MRNINKIHSVLDWKMKFLEIAKISLETYKKTNDQKFYEDARYFWDEAEKMEKKYRGLL